MYIEINMGVIQNKSQTPTWTIWVRWSTAKAGETAWMANSWCLRWSHSNLPFYFFLSFLFFYCLLCFCSHCFLFGISCQMLWECSAVDSWPQSRPTAYNDRRQIRQGWSPGENKEKIKTWKLDWVPSQKETVWASGRKVREGDTEAAEQQRWNWRGKMPPDTSVSTEFSTPKLKDLTPKWTTTQSQKKRKRMATMEWIFLLWLSETKTTLFVDTYKRKGEKKRKKSDNFVLPKPLIR